MSINEKKLDDLTRKVDDLSKKVEPIIKKYEWDNRQVSFVNLEKVKQRRERGERGEVR